MKTGTHATAWKWFSLYIRIKDSFEGGFVKCCSCNTYKHFRDMQAGHYYTQGAYKRIVFDERNTAPQCVACNMYKSGNLGEYAIYMIHKHGEQIFEQLKFVNRVNPRGYDYVKIADEYRLKVHVLCKAKGIAL